MVAIRCGKWSRDVERIRSIVVETISKKYAISLSYWLHMGPLHETNYLIPYGYESIGVDTVKFWNSLYMCVAEVRIPFELRPSCK